MTSTIHGAERESPGRSRPARLLFGPPTRPRWVRPGLLALLVGTAALYLVGLSASGWANDFYAAATQAGTQNWKALLFGSLDAGNAITVDKPPAALWVMGLSGRVLGFGSFSLLLPQALLGVGSVALLFVAVRRWSGDGAGLLAGAALAVTPVAALMFRFDNPDALLTLLLVAAAYCTVRAVDGASTRWLVSAGLAIGFAFLTKLMQAFLVLPALGAVFLIAAPMIMRKRIGALCLACLAVVVSGGWFVALVQLWPADSRPYIGGSTDNSLLQLALGYNGLGRVLGGDGNGGGPHGGGRHGGGGNNAFGGATGITRLFGDSMGVEISWLLPVALLGLVAGLWFTRRAPRADRVRAGLLLWGGWLAVTGVVFSYMQGTIHPYYTVALAPAVAAAAAVSVRELWRGRQQLSARVVLGAMAAATGIWNFVLLDRTPDWLPSLRWVLLVGAVVVASVLIVGGHRSRRFTAVLAVAGLLFGLGGTTAYAVETASRSHSGGIPTSGPAVAGHQSGGPGGGRRGDGRPDDSRDAGALADMLKQADNRWAAAAVGSFATNRLELSTGKSVMAIGGFSGRDESPTPAQFQRYVAEREVRYFILDGEMGGRDRDSAGSAGQISRWVKAHFTPLTAGSTTVYDLTSRLNS